MLKSASTDPNQAPHPEAYRKAMKIALAYLMNEAGVQASEESVLETLTEMMQSCMFVTLSCFWSSYILAWLAIRHRWKDNLMGDASM